MRAVIALLVMLGTVPSAGAQSFKAAVEDALALGDIGYPLGVLDLVSRGPNYRNRIPSEWLDHYLGLEKTGFVNIRADEGFQSHAQGRSFSWGALLNQTTGFVEQRIAVRPTPKGETFVKNNWFLFSPGKNEVRKIVKTEDVKKGGETYRLAYVRVTFKPSSIYQELQTFLGKSISTDRKGVLLFRQDVFDGRWLKVDSKLVGVSEDLPPASALFNELQ